MDVEETPHRGDVREHGDQHQGGEQQMVDGMDGAWFDDVGQRGREHAGDPDVHRALAAIHRAHARVDAVDLAFGARIRDQQRAPERYDRQPEAERIRAVVRGDPGERGDLRIPIDGRVDQLAGLGRRAPGARHHPVQRVENRAEDHQTAARVGFADGEGGGTGDAARERCDGDLVGGDAQRNRRALERRETPIPELDEKAAEEEAARLFARALVLVAAEYGDPDAIRGKQHRAGCGGEEDQHQSTDPSLCRALRSDVRI